MYPFPIKLPSPYSSEITHEFEYSKESLSEYIESESRIKKDKMTFSQNVEFSEKFKEQA